MEEYTIIGLFAAILLYHKVNVSYLFKRLFKIRVNKKIKLLDCFPCFSFWLSIVIGLSLVHLTNNSYVDILQASMAVFVISFIIDKN